MVRKRKKREYNATADSILSTINDLPLSELSRYKNGAAKRGTKLSELIAEEIDCGILEAAGVDSAGQTEAKLEFEVRNGDGNPERTMDGGRMKLKREVLDEENCAGSKKRKRSRRSRVSEGDDCGLACAEAPEQEHGVSSLSGAAKKSVGGHGHAKNSCNGQTLKGDVTLASHPYQSKSLVGMTILQPTCQEDQLSATGEEGSDQYKVHRTGDTKYGEEHITQMRFADDTPDENLADEFVDVPSTQDWQLWADSPIGKNLLSSSPTKKSGERDVFARQDSFIGLTSSYDPGPKRPKKECCVEESPCPQRWQAIKSPGFRGKFYAVRQGRKLGIYYRWDGPEGAEVQVRSYRGSKQQSFRTAEEAEQFMNLPSVAGCYTSTLCCGCAEVLDDYTRSSVCAVCTLRQVAELHSLCDEQTDILGLVSKGHNVFFTGAAGTGKSTTLKAIIRLLHRMGKVTNAVASTGIAALILGGTTIHLFAGWNIKASKELPLDEMKRNAWNKKNKDRLRAPDVLIIDEISMVESSMFSRLDAVMREVRIPSLPFGGVQLIVSGDFHQLPPVLPFETCLYCGHMLEGWKDRMPEYTCPRHRTWRNEEKWAFACEAWTNCGFVCRQLVQIHRQADSAFVSLLNHLRKGELTEGEEALLIDHPSDFDMSEAVQIYPLRSKVDYINDSNLNALPYPAHICDCVDNYVWHRREHPELESRLTRVDSDPRSPFRAYQDERHRFIDTLELKESMPVLLLANISVSEGLVNGTRGRLVSFQAVDFGALPHKRRGKKYEGYSPGLFLGGEHAEYQEREIRAFARRMAPRAPEKRAYWPVVEFENGTTRTIYPHCEVTELGRTEPYSLMSRTQIPLTAGWAITIHKSQGMTLSSAVVDTDHAWEYGQSYVAMSRVKSLKGLFVQGLASGKAVMADPTVLKFMKETFGDSGEGTG